ncbi:MAG: adenosylcobinamide-GDP ribazoletransferase, partial [Spirochaetae bacterium HGW-Spirochaetae-4]
GRRRIGGVTGDLLGATVELSETLMFVAAVLVPLP